LALRYPLQEGIPIPRHSWAQLAGGATASGLLLHLAIYVAVTAIYTYALHVVLTRIPAAGPQHRQVAAVVVSGWLLTVLVLLAVAPGGETHDIFDYIFRGRMLVESGASPLAETPSSFHTAPFYRYVSWTDHVDTYGPLWEYASATTALSARAGLVLLGHWYAAVPSCPRSTASCTMLLGYVLAYRLLAVTLGAICGWLIYMLVKATAPKLALAALLAWMWNPLALIASAVGAHNDMLMLFLVLASFWTLQRRWWMAALLLFFLAAHVKLTALTLMPVYGLWLVRELGWQRALLLVLAAVLGGIALSWLLYAPLGGWETLPRMLEERQRYVALSFHHLLYRVLYAHGVDAGLNRFLTIQGPSLLYLFGAILIAGGILGWRRVAPVHHRIAGTTHEGGETGADIDGIQLFWHAAIAGNLFYLVLGSFWFQPWYMLWVLAPAALLPGSRFTRYVLPCLCAGALCGNVVADYLPQLPAPPFDRTGRLAITLLATWLPAAAAALVLLVLPKWSGRR
jgi:hypothetical protein